MHMQKEEKNEDLLALKVNKVSFEEERVNKNKANEDELLYWFEYI